MFEQSAVVLNVLLTGTLLTSVYKTKYVLALNFRKCNFFSGILFGLLFQQEEATMGKMLVLGERGRKAIFP